MPNIPYNPFEPGSLNIGKPTEETKRKRLQEIIENTKPETAAEKAERLRLEKLNYKQNLEDQKNERISQYNTDISNAKELALHSSFGRVTNNFNTDLGEREREYRKWRDNWFKTQDGINFHKRGNSEENYDLRGYYLYWRNKKNPFGPLSNNMPEIWTKPNNPYYSRNSLYTTKNAFHDNADLADGFARFAGYWDKKTGKWVSASQARKEQDANQKLLDKIFHRQEYSDAYVYMVLNGQKDVMMSIFSNQKNFQTPKETILGGKKQKGGITTIKKKPDFRLSQTYLDFAKEIQKKYEEESIKPKKQNTSTLISTTNKIANKVVSFISNNFENIDEEATKHALLAPVMATYKAINTMASMIDSATRGDMQQQDSDLGRKIKELKDYIKKNEISAKDFQDKSKVQKFFLGVNKIASDILPYLVLAELTGGVSLAGGEAVAGAEALALEVGEGTLKEFGAIQKLINLGKKGVTGSLKGLGKVNYTDIMLGFSAPWDQMGDIYEIRKKLLKDGFKPTGNPQIDEYYKSILKNPKRIEIDCFVKGLLNTAAFTTLGNAQKLGPLFRAVAKKFGIKRAESYFADVIATRMIKTGTADVKMTESAGKQAVQIGTQAVGLGVTNLAIDTSSQMTDSLLLDADTDFSASRMFGSFISGAGAGLLFGFPSLMKLKKINENDNFIYKQESKIRAGESIVKNDQIRQTDVGQHLDLTDAYFKLQKSLDGLKGQPDKVKMALDLTKEANMKEAIVKNNIPEDVVKLATNLKGFSLREKLYKKDITPIAELYKMHKEIVDIVNEPINPLLKSKDLKTDDNSHIANHLDMVLGSREDMSASSKEAFVSSMLQKGHQIDAAEDLIAQRLQECEALKDELLKAGVPERKIKAAERALEDVKTYAPGEDFQTSIEKNISHLQKHETDELLNAYVTKKYVLKDMEQKIAEARQKFQDDVNLDKLINEWAKNWHETIEPEVQNARNDKHDMFQGEDKETKTENIEETEDSETYQQLHEEETQQVQEILESSAIKDEHQEKHISKAVDDILDSDESLTRQQKDMSSELIKNTLDVLHSTGEEGSANTPVGELTIKQGEEGLTAELDGEEIAQADNVAEIIKQSAKAIKEEIKNNTPPHKHEPTIDTYDDDAPEEPFHVEYGGKILSQKEGSQVEGLINHSNCLISRAPTTGSNENLHNDLSAKYGENEKIELDKKSESTPLIQEWINSEDPIKTLEMYEKKNPEAWKHVVNNFGISMRGISTGNPKTPGEFESMERALKTYVKAKGNPRVKVHTQHVGFADTSDKEKYPVTSLGTKENKQFLKENGFKIVPSKKGKGVDLIIGDTKYIDGSAVRQHIFPKMAGMDPKSCYGLGQFNIADNLARLFTHVVQHGDVLLKANEGNVFGIATDGDIWGSKVLGKFLNTKPQSSAEIESWSKGKRKEAMDVFLHGDMGAKKMHLWQNGKYKKAKVDENSRADIVHAAAARIAKRKIDINHDELEVPSEVNLTIGTGSRAFKIKKGEKLIDSYINNNVFYANQNLRYPHANSLVIIELYDQESPSGQINMAQNSLLSEAPDTVVEETLETAILPKDPNLTLIEDGEERQIVDTSLFYDEISPIIYKRKDQEMSHIPNSYVYEQLVKGIGDRIVDTVINAGLENETDLKRAVREVLYDLSGIPKNQLDHARGVRKDIDNNIDAFCVDLIKYFNENDPVAIVAGENIDALGETRAFIQATGETDPYVTGAPRLLAILSKVNGFYDPETTLFTSGNTNVVKRTLMHALGGKVKSREELLSILKESKNPLCKNFYNLLVGDVDLQTAAFTLFNVQKNNYLNVRLAEHGLKIDNSSTSLHNFDIHKLNQHLEKLSVDRPQLQSVIRQINELSANRDKNVKDFDTYSLYLSNLCNLIGFTVDNHMWRSVANDYYDRIGKDSPTLKKRFEEGGKAKENALKECLDEALNSAEFIRLLGYEDSMFRDPQTREPYSIYSNVVDALRVAQKGVPMRFHQNASKAITKAVVFNHIYADAPTINVRDANGKSKYLYQDPSALTERIRDLQNPEFLQQLATVPGYEDNYYVNTLANNKQELEVCEILNYNEKADMSSVDKTIFRLAAGLYPENLGILQQISDKPSITIIRGLPPIPDEYLDDPAAWIAEHSCKGELQAMVAAHKNRARLLEFTGPEFEAMSSEAQQEKLGLKSLKDFGMIKGVHYEIGGDGKIKLDGPVYHPINFPFLEEMVGEFVNIDPPYLEIAFNKRFKKPEMAQLVQEELVESLYNYVLLLADKGLIQVDPKKLKPGTNGLMAITAKTETFPTESSTISRDEELGNQIIFTEATRQVTEQDKSKWEEGVQQLAWNIMQKMIKEDPVYMNLKYRYKIEEGSVGLDHLVELITKKKGDIFFGGDNLRNTELGQKFGEEFGWSPEEKYSKENQHLAEVLGQISNSHNMQIFNNIELNPLIFGSQAIYGSRGAQTKRISGIKSTGKAYITDFPVGHELCGKEAYTAMNVNDIQYADPAFFEASLKARVGTIEKPSQLLQLEFKAQPDRSKEAIYKEVREREKNNLAGLAGSVATDGQIFMTVKHARECMIRQHQWGAAQQEAYVKMLSGKTGWENEILFTPLKDVGYHPMMNEEGADPFSYYTYQKSSLYIIPHDHELSKWMMENDIDIIIPESCTKIGGIETAPLFKEGGEIDEEVLKSKKYIQDFPWTGRKHQLPLDAHKAGLGKLSIQSMQILLNESSPTNKKSLEAVYNEIQKFNFKKRNTIRFALKENSLVSDLLLKKKQLAGVPIGATGPVVFKSILKSTATNMFEHKVTQVSSALFKEPLKMFDEHGLCEIVISAGSSKNIPKTWSFGEQQEYVKACKESNKGVYPVIIKRIPSQGQESLRSCNVKDIVPNAGGDICHTPNQLAKADGHDYDGDSSYNTTPIFVDVPKKGSTGWKKHSGLKAKFDKIKKESDDLFCENTEAIVFAKEHKCVYKDGEFYGREKGARDFIENTDRLLMKKENTAGANTNKFIECASKILTDPHYSIGWTSSVDGVTAKTKEMINSLEPKPKQFALQSVAPSTQIIESEKSLGGTDSIGPFALTNSCRGIGETVYKGELLYNIDYENPTKLRGRNIKSVLAIEGRNGITNKTGGLISADLSAAISFAVDSTKDPVLARANIDKNMSPLLAMLLAEGHGDAAYYFFFNPGVIEYKKQRESLGRGKAFDAAFEKFLKILYGNDIDMSGDKGKSLLAANNYASMDTETLLADAKKYKRYVEEGIPVEDWNKNFVKRQLGLLTQIPVLEKASAVNRKLQVYNQLNKAEGNTFAQVHNIINEAFDGDFVIIKDLIPEEDYTDTHINKLVTFLKLIEENQEKFPLLLSDIVYNACSFVYSNFRNLNDQAKNILYQAVVSQTIANGMADLGLSTETLVKGQESVKRQYDYLVNKGVIEPTMPIMRFMKTGNTTAVKGKKALVETCYFDIHEIQDKNLEHDVTNAIRQVFNIDTAETKKFCHDLLSLMLLMQSNGQAPELFPAEVVSSHPYLEKVAKRLNSLELPEDIKNIAKRIALDVIRGKLKDKNLEFNTTVPNGIKWTGDGFSIDKRPSNKPYYILKKGKENILYQYDYSKGDVDFYAPMEESGTKLLEGGFIHSGEALDLLPDESLGGVMPDVDDLDEPEFDSEKIQKIEEDKGVTIGNKDVSFGDEFFSSAKTITALKEKTKNLFDMNPNVTCPKQAEMTRTQWLIVESIFNQNGISGKNLRGTTTFDYAPSATSPYARVTSPEEKMQLKDVIAKVKVISTALRTGKLGVLQTLPDEAKNFISSVITSQEDMNYVAKNLSQVVSLLSMSDKRASRVLREMNINPEVAVKRIMAHIDHPVTQRMINFRFSSDGNVNDPLIANLSRKDKETLVKYSIDC